MPELWKSKKYMTMLYVKQRKKPEEIAEMLKTSRATIYRWLEKHGLIK